MTHPAVIERRRRVQRIRARVAAGTVALFIALFGGLYVQMASGNDPALSAASGQVASTSTSTTDSPASTSPDSPAMTTQAS